MSALATAAMVGSTESTVLSTEIGICFYMLASVFATKQLQIDQDICD